MSRVPRTLVAFILISTVAGAGIMAQAPSPQSPSARGSDSARTAELVKYALEKFEQGQSAAQPATANRPAPERPVITLSGDEAVKQAIANNIELSVERLNPQLQDIALDSVKAFYTPTLTSSLNETSSKTLSTSQLSGGATVTSLGNNWNAGLTKAIPWFGGSATANWTNSRTDSDNAFATVNPTYQSRLTLNYTQPLWRNLKIDTTRQQLISTRAARDIADLTLRSRLINTEANTRNAYWDLWHSIRALDASRNSLKLAEKLVEDNQIRVEVGTLAPIDVVSAQAEAANRRQAVAAAEATWQTAEITLKRLLVSSTTDPLWNARIDPTDPPTVTHPPLNLAGAITSALEKRTDIITARRNITVSDANLIFLRNQFKPQLDLVGTFGTNGTGGTTLNRASGSLGGGIISTTPGGYGDALSGLAKMKLPSWTVQANFSYPLGMSVAKTSFARAKVQYSQSEIQLRALELQVATDLTNAALTIQSAEKRLDAATAARVLAERKLDAEQSKYEVGMQTNYFVVQAQRDLLDSQITELRAQVDLRKALISYERLQITSSSSGGGTSSAGATSTGGGA